MLTTALAGSDQLVGYWRPLSDAEADVVDNLLSVASMVVRSKRPAIDDWISRGLVDASVVAYVVSRIVIDVLSRPNGVKSETEQVGTFSRSVTYDTTLDSMAPADDLLALITPAQPAQSAVARTIHLAVGHPQWQRRGLPWW